MQIFVYEAFFLFWLFFHSTGSAQSTNFPTFTASAVTRN